MEKNGPWVLDVTEAVLIRSRQQLRPDSQEIPDGIPLACGTDITSLNTNRGTCFWYVRPIDTTESSGTPNLLRTRRLTMLAKSGRQLH